MKLFDLKNIFPVGNVAWKPPENLFQQLGLGVKPETFNKFDIVDDTKPDLDYTQVYPDLCPKIEVDEAKHTYSLIPKLSALLETWSEYL